MAKELPYFQFEPAEYLTKDISFCSLPAQGLFINICSYYWQRQCSLSKEQFLRRFNYETEFNELVKEGVIDVLDGIITVKFLDLQYQKATEKSQKNSSNGAKGGRPKNPIKTELKPNENPNESELKGIREEKIREDNKNTQPKVDWDALLLAFNELTKRNFKIIPEKAKRQILARLKEGYNKSDLWNAIENCYNDEYHKETNHKYLTLEFISRPDKMEKYSVDVIKPNKPKVNIEL